MKIAGIDVSSKTVTLVIDQASRTGKPRKFRNAPEGHVGLSKVLCKAQVSRVGLEAWILDVMVINPKAAKRSA